jgi:hypothetical protein
MSLFSRLLNLNTGNIPLEDFFTELVAYLFSTNKGILYAWLKELNLFDANAYLDAHISTQREFEPVDGQIRSGISNIIDIVIELADENSCDIIFIESKVGSKAMFGQLEDYAKVLNSPLNYRHKYLLYITRDYDPKVEKDIFEGITDCDVQFKQLRWHQFYLFLRSQPDTMLVQEIILFMSKYNMAHNNQFSSIDIIALANFPTALKLMQETMLHKVLTKFEKVLGRPRNRASALTQVDYNGQYIMVVDMPNNWWGMLGFVLKTDSLTDYPRVRLGIQVHPSSPRREEIIAAMKKVCKQEKWKSWEGHGLNDSRAWSSIIREKSLQDFLSQPDHIIAIEEFFLEALGELKDIRNQYPDLPWKAIMANDTDEIPEDEIARTFPEDEEPIITPPPELTGMATANDTESDSRKALFAEELDLKHQLKVLLSSDNYDEDAEVEIGDKLDIVRTKIGSRTVEEAYGAMAY